MLMATTSMVMLHVMAASGAMVKNQNQGWRYQGATGVSTVIKLRLGVSFKLYLSVVS
jgi:hypothetical protein